MKRNLIIGVDVSKKTLDYAEAAVGSTWTGMERVPVQQIPNEVDSITLLLSEVSKEDCLFVFEPTGTYSDKLMSLLTENEYRFALVNPKQAHHFASFLGITNKTDAQAARMLAHMGATQDLPVYQVPDKATKTRKQLLTVLNGLSKYKQAMENQLHALNQYYQPNSIAISALEEVLSTLDQQIDKLKKELKKCSADTEFRAQKTLVMSIKGIGQVSAEWVLIITDGLKNFHTSNQLVKYCGLAPGKHQSGTSVRINAGVSKQACAKIRATLYMAAISAIRYNNACRDLYQRLRAKGKPHYKVMTAVMAKLLRQIFGVLKSGKPFDNDEYLKYQKKLPLLAQNS